MNIGMICYPHFGGSGIVAAELGMKLAELGHQVHFITSDPPVRLIDFTPNLYFHQVEVHNYPVSKYPLYTLALASKIIQVVQDNDLELIHAHYALPHSTCAILAKDALKDKRKLKVVTTLHGTDITLVGQDDSYLPMVEHAINASDRVTAVSRFLANTTEKDFSINKQINVIYNFVDMERFGPTPKCDETQAFLGLENLCFHISNFRPVKNTIAVVNTFAKMKNIKSSKLVLIGEGPDISKIRKRVNELGLSAQVLFLGSVEQVECLLPYATLLFQPSYTESFGLTVLEAMSCMVPTITSNRGGLPEVVKHGETGFLCEPDDTDKMAEYADLIIDNKDLQKKMGLAGRQLAENRFSVEPIMENYLNIYKDALES